MTDTTPANEREAFEAWFATMEEAPWYEGIQHAIMQNAWLSALEWKARAASQPAQEPSKVSRDALMQQSAKCWSLARRIANDEPYKLSEVDSELRWAANYLQTVAQSSQPAQEPVARLHPTDIYNFAGWLTMRPGMMKVGGAFDAAPMADAVSEYLDKFPERFAAPPAATAQADRIMELESLLREARD